MEFTQSRIPAGDEFVGYATLHVSEGDTVPHGATLVKRANRSCRCWTASPRSVLREGSDASLRRTFLHELVSTPRERTYGPTLSCSWVISEDFWSKRPRSASRASATPTAIRS
jgi:hypothetical protein